MNEIELEPCHICRKRPSSAWCINRTAESICIIKCKPFLQKSHLIVRVLGANQPQAIRKAVDAWNERVKNESSNKDDM